MTRKTRQAIFWIFFVLFAVIGPVIILYARGYRFDFVKKKFVATGAFFIKSDPPGAAIYVNGVRKGETSGTLKDVLTKSSLIANILPGEYDIRVEKKEYIPWVKKLTVRARQVTEARSIFLLPEGSVPKTLYFNTIYDASVASDGKSAMVISESTATTWIATINTETREQKTIYSQKEDTDAVRRLLAKKTVTAGKTPYSALHIRGFAKNNRFILMEDDRRDALPSFFIVDQEKPNTVTFRLSPTSTRLVRMLSIENDRAFFADSANNLYAWRFSEKSSTRLTTATSWGAVERNGRLFTIAGSPPMLYASTFDGKNREQLTNTPMTENTGYSSLQVEEILGESFVVLVTPVGSNGGDLTRINTDGTLAKLQDHVRDLEISPDGKKLLVRTWNELWTLYLDDMLVQPVREKNDMVLVARFGVAIKDAKWLTSDYVLYTIPEGLFAIELDDRGSVRNNLDLIRNGDIELKAVTHDAIYFTAQDRLQKFSLKPDPKK